MVGMAMTFGTADYSTPHGGAPFHGWKKGFGFGHGDQAVAGQGLLAPSVPLKLKNGPKGERGFSASPFWRSKYEVGKAAGMGIGDRPDYARMANKSGSVAPDNYGDVAVHVKNSRKNCTRSGITFHRKIEALKAGDPGGPGPARYDTSYKPGQSSWDHGAKNPSFSFQSRRVVDQELVYKMTMPGPDTYNVRFKSGEKPFDRHSSLYDLDFRGKIPTKGPGFNSPGPARYKVKGEFDKCTQGLMIEHTPLPKEQLPRWYSQPEMLKMGGGGGGKGFKGFRSTAPSAMHASDRTQVFAAEDPYAEDVHGEPGAGDAFAMTHDSAFEASKTQGSLQETSSG